MLTDIELVLSDADIFEEIICQSIGNVAPVELYIVVLVPLRCACVVVIVVGEWRGATRGFLTKTEKAKREYGHHNQIKPASLSACEAV